MMLNFFYWRQFYIFWLFWKIQLIFQQQATDFLTCRKMWVLICVLHEETRSQKWRRRRKCLLNSSWSSVDVNFLTQQFMTRFYSWQKKFSSLVIVREFARLFSIDQAYNEQRASESSFATTRQIHLRIYTVLLMCELHFAQFLICEWFFHDVCSAYYTRHSSLYTSFAAQKWAFFYWLLIEMRLHSSQQSCNQTMTMIQNVLTRAN